MKAAVVLVGSLGLALLACDENDGIKCDDNSDCIQGGVPGMCLPSPESSSNWCAFPDGTCGSGQRWGIKSGDGLGGDCVTGGFPDAGEADAPPGPGDGGPPDAGPDAMPGEWSEPSLVANVNTGGAELDPSIAGDGLELFFSAFRSGSPGGLGDLMVARRASTVEPFGTPEYITVLCTDQNELGPEISANGLELYFSRAAQLHVATRANRAAAWGASTALGIQGTSPSLSGDGLTLYFAPPSGGFSMVKRAAVGGAWGPPTSLAALPGGLKYNELDVSPDERSVLFSGPAAGGQSSMMLGVRATVADQFTMSTIPALSFIESHRGASWGPEQREIYLSGEYAVGGIGNKDIFVSVLP
jgi:hypothetical protein